MSVSGINGLPFPSGWPQGTDRVAGDRETSVGDANADVTARKAIGGVGSGHGTEAPEGVDAAFWSVLTAEERAHFDRLGGVSGLTYAPGARGGARAPRGGRIDVRA